MQTIFFTGRRFLLAAIFVGLFSLFASSTSFAGEDPVYTSLFSNEAVGGYDVTAYFSDNKPVKGKSGFSMEYKGASWRFVSQENLDEFKADPEKYAPQFGGYCAWAIAKGDLQKGDPEYWDIQDGKLYLTFDEKIQQTWRSDRVNLIDRANQEWPAVLDK